MNALRSSPLSVFALASALQVFILSCCVAGLLLRQVFMNALRSSPFLSAASVLQVAILDCCLVCAAAGAEAGAAGRLPRALLLPVRRRGLERSWLQVLRPQRRRVHRRHGLR